MARAGEHECSIHQVVASPFASGILFRKLPNTELKRVFLKREIDEKNGDFKRLNAQSLEFRVTALLLWLRGNPGMVCSSWGKISSLGFVVEIW